MSDAPEGTSRVHNSPRHGPIELLRRAVDRVRGDPEADDRPLDDVPDDTLEDAAFEIRQRASFIGWTDEEREEEFLAIADHLLDQREGSDPDD